MKIINPKIKKGKDSSETSARVLDTASNRLRLQRVNYNLLPGASYPTEDREYIGASHI